MRYLLILECGHFDRCEHDPEFEERVTCPFCGQATVVSDYVDTEAVDVHAEEARPEG